MGVTNYLLTGMILQVVSGSLLLCSSRTPYPRLILISHHRPVETNRNTGGKTPKVCRLRQLGKTRKHTATFRANWSWKRFFVLVATSTCHPWKWNMFSKYQQQHIKPNIRCVFFFFFFFSVPSDGLSLEKFTVQSSLSLTHPPFLAFRERPHGWNVAVPRLDGETSNTMMDWDWDFWYIYRSWTNHGTGTSCWYLVTGL